MLRLTGPDAGRLTSKEACIPAMLVYSSRKEDDALVFSETRRNT